MDNKNPHYTRSEFHRCLYSNSILHQYIKSFHCGQCRVELWCDHPKELPRTLLPEPDSSAWRNVVDWTCSGQCNLWRINSWLLTSQCCGLTTRILWRNITQKFNSTGFLGKLLCYRQWYESWNWAGRVLSCASFLSYCQLSGRSFVYVKIVCLYILYYCSSGFIQVWIRHIIMSFLSV